MFDEIPLGPTTTILTYDPQSQTHITVDRLVAAYLFGSFRAEGVRKWIDGVIGDEAADFGAFCEEVARKFASGEYTEENLP